MTIEVKYRKPVPYETKLFGRGVVTKDMTKFLKVKAEILNEKGEVLAEAEVKYIKLTVEQIAGEVDAHEEMCYLIDDGVTDISFEN